MADEMEKLGAAVGISTTAEGLQFTLTIGGQEVTGTFLTAPAEDAQLAVRLEREPGAEAGAASEQQATFKLIVTSGSDREEHEGLSLKEGRSDDATRVNAASKLIKLEETG